MYWKHFSSKSMCIAFHIRFFQLENYLSSCCFKLSPFFFNESWLYSFRQLVLLNSIFDFSHHLNLAFKSNSLYFRRDDIKYAYNQPTKNYWTFPMLFKFLFNWKENILNFHKKLKGNLKMMEWYFLLIQRCIAYFPILNIILK